MQENKFPLYYHAFIPVFALFAMKHWNILFVITSQAKYNYCFTPVQCAKIIMNFSIAYLNFESGRLKWYVCINLKIM